MYFILFQSEKDRQWYWHLRADNHQIIASGAEGYVSKQGATNGILLVKSNAATAPVYDDSQKRWV
jgi:hypothetical protein